MANYTQTYINNDMSKLNTVLQTLVTNGIVGAVDYDDSGTYAVFTIYADAEKTTEVFRITQSAGYGGGAYKYTFMATASDGTTLSSTGVITAATGTTYVYGYTFEYGYATANGIMVSVLAKNTYNGTAQFTSFWFMITKNESGKPVFIWTNNANVNGAFLDQIKTNMNTEYIIASSDVAPLATASRSTPSNRNQTVLSPFYSCCDTGETSYTPDAGRILAGTMNDFIYSYAAHEITFDNSTWLTNGYWAIRV